MEKKTFNKLDLDVFEETLDCGLRVFVAPVDRHEALAKITVHYGSSVVEFKSNFHDDFVKIPLGTAHFLEHKMFAKEDGSDAMSILGANGANSNAYTSSHVTSYYFSSPNLFFENLKVLLDLVNKPYYTDENVFKEMGIIEQEIKSGFDDPSEMAYYTTLLNTFDKLPFRYPVAGYCESIREITPKVLYDCYNTFYHPSNMTLTITGNVNPDKVIDFVKNYYDEFNFKESSFEVKKYDEDVDVVCGSETVYMDVTNNIICNGYKICFDGIDLEFFKLIAYIEIYLDAKFGKISRFNKDCYCDKNILSPVRYSFDVKDNYLFLIFETKVSSVDDIFDKIYDNLNDKYITEEDFELIYKNEIKEMILMTENVGSANGAIDYQVYRYGRVLYDMYDIYKSLNYDECMSVIDKLDFTHNTKTIVTRKTS